MTAITVTGFFGFSAVALGAFGAHALDSMFLSAPERLEWWTTASHYHLLHSVQLGVLCIVRDQLRNRAQSMATHAFRLTVVGILVFSGTLYAMALGAPKWFGAITPIGGLCLLGAWGALALAGHRMTRPSSGEA